MVCTASEWLTTTTNGRKTEGVPALLRIARSNPDPELRKTALFWLGQSEDPRALALFEEILR
jgi:hypothetical protein